jgi:hypothetical protein
MVLRTRYNIRGYECGSLAAQADRDGQAGLPPRAGDKAGGEQSSSRFGLPGVSPKRREQAPALHEMPGMLGTESGGEDRSEAPGNLPEVRPMGAPRVGCAGVRRRLVRVLGRRRPRVCGRLRLLSRVPGQRFKLVNQAGKRGQIKVMEPAGNAINH